MVKVSASQPVDLGFISQVKLYHKTSKNSIQSFPALRSAQKEQCGEQACKLACCVLSRDTEGDAFIFMWQTDGGAKKSIRRGGQV